MGLFLFREGVVKLKRLDLRNRVHLFQVGELRLALDINSGSLHAIDEVVWDLLPDYGELTAEEMVQKWAGTHNLGEIETALEAIGRLVERGQLFTPPSPLLLGSSGQTGAGEDEDFREEKHPRPLRLKALCLHAAHDCNLRCTYCFAGQGDFGQGRKLMPAETARRAIAFLLANSGPRRNLAVDFFGGEPLLNWSVVKEAILYGKEEAAQQGKHLDFTVTTNALLLDEEKIRFLLEEDVSVVLSLDGRPEVHDATRKRIDGRGSYDLVLPRIKSFIEAWEEWHRRHPEARAYYYVRGTYTRLNLDFASDAAHLLAQGVNRFSLEPVVTKDPLLGIRSEDVPALEKEYERLAELYLEHRSEGRPFEFYHFNLDLYQGPCLAKRLTGCGAGTEYLAVTPEGDLYPCHQFVGRPGYRLGTLAEGVTAPRTVERFAGAHVLAKPSCQECWARFYCSGGCHASADLFHGNLHTPYEVGCALQRKRLECALAVRAVEVLRQEEVM